MRASIGAPSSTRRPAAHRPHRRASSGSGSGLAGPSTGHADVLGLLRVSVVRRTPSFSRWRRATSSSGFGGSVTCFWYSAGFCQSSSWAQHLVRERRAHHERRMAGRTAGFKEPALGEHGEDRVAVGKTHSSYCGLMFPLLDAHVFARPACRSRCRSGRCRRMASSFIRAMCRGDDAPRCRSSTKTSALST